MGLFSFLSFLVTTSLGTLYPIYLSYKAIKNNNLQSLEILLMFWIIMGIIHAVESTFGWFLHWIPFFYQFKSIFMLWLTLPQIQGSTYLYVTYVHPFLLEHEVEIDTWLINMKEKCRDAGTCYFYQFVDKLKEMLLRAINVPENDRRRLNGVQQSQPQDAQERQIDIASAYALNWIRQFGPAASAIFQPMSTQMPNSFPPRPQNYLSSSDNQSLFPTSHPSELDFRTEPDGYRIPDYDELPVPSISRESRDPSLSSRRPPMSHNPSSDSLATGRPSSRTNLHLSGYDEIGRDEASGSENESLLLSKQTARASSSSSSLFNPRPRLSDGNQVTPSPRSIDPSGKRSTSAGSRWFSWTSKNSVDVSDAKKRN